MFRTSLARLPRVIPVIRGLAKNCFHVCCPCVVNPVLLTRLALKSITQALREIPAHVVTTRVRLVTCPGVFTQMAPTSRGKILLYVTTIKASSPSIHDITT